MFLLCRIFNRILVFKSNFTQHGRMIPTCSPWRHSQTAPQSCDGAASAQARSVALRVEPAAAVQGQCQGQVMWQIYCNMGHFLKFF
jgi:hypothetical protein